MRAEYLGERSLIIRELKESPIIVAAKFMQRLPGLEDAVPCYDTVGLYFKGKVPSLELLQEVLNKSIELGKPAHHCIPVCYELGLDFMEAADQLGMTRDELARNHASRSYLCAAVGFVPGFAYLGDLSAEISSLSRLRSPRIAVPAGSVAIVGKQTAIYPKSTPGGWWIIGKTPLEVADEKEDYFPISAGDSVTFYACDQPTFDKMQGMRL